MPNNDLTFTAKEPGAAGNDIFVTYEQVGVETAETTASAEDQHISVLLSETGDGEDVRAFVDTDYADPDSNVRIHASDAIVIGGGQAIRAYFAIGGVTPVIQAGANGPYYYLRFLIPTGTTAQELVEFVEGNPMTSMSQNILDIISMELAPGSDGSGEINDDWGNISYTVGGARGVLMEVAGIQIYGYDPGEYYNDKMAVVFSVDNGSTESETTFSKVWSISDGVDPPAGTPESVFWLYEAKLQVDGDGDSVAQCGGVLNAIQIASSSPQVAAKLLDGFSFGDVIVVTAEDGAVLGGEDGGRYFLGFGARENQNPDIEGAPSAITSTALDVKAAIEADANSNALVEVELASESDGTGIVTETAFDLEDGADPGVPTSTRQDLVEAWNDDQAVLALLEPLDINDGELILEDSSQTTVGGNSSLRSTQIWAGGI